MKPLFSENNETEIMEKFAIIFDRAKNEATAKTNALDYYLCLVEDEDIHADVAMIVELAEEFGYDLSDLNEMIEDNV
jgi:hypothetical protein